MSNVTQGSRELSGARGRITAREAFALVDPLLREISSHPALVVITSGTSIDAEGRANTWEFVFHLPDRKAQAVYTFESTDPERSDSHLRLAWRVSPRGEGVSSSLPLDFVDSPDAARALGAQGVDWVSGDPDLTLSVRAPAGGVAAWTVESYGQTYTTPFAPPAH